MVGLHFFSPANIMKLLEVVRGEKTAPDVLVTAMQLAKRIRKVAVVAGVCYGFIGNRMLMPRQIQANQLLLEGATPSDRPRPCRIRNAVGRSRWPIWPVSILLAPRSRADRNVRDKLCALDDGARKKARLFTIMTKKGAPPITLW